MRKWIVTLAVLLAVILGLAAALADEAPDISARCAFSSKGAGGKELRTLTDGKYTTYLKVRAGGEILIDGKGRTLGSVTVRFYDRPTETEFLARTGGEWVSAGVRGRYLSDWVEMPAGTDAIRLVNTSRSRMMMAEVTVFGTGDRPDMSPEWHDCGKADLLVAACHPDDELLWLGGLLPTYAGERGLEVMVVYGVPSTPLRRLELLDGLCHCGVRCYPAFLNLPDRYCKTLESAYRNWGKNKMHRLMTEMIRRYRPEVVVTHDLKGEYGHGGHQAVADTVCKAVGFAADASRFEASAKTYGVWQVKKCYLHLYAEGQIRLDWHRPLARFGGKDGLTVATEALAMHRSQVAHGWAMEDGGETDNSLFGLWFTAVGPDERGDDLFEHIPGAAPAPPETLTVEGEDIEMVELEEDGDV